jgi:hypothetical protein
MSFFRQFFGSGQGDSLAPPSPNGPVVGGGPSLAQLLPAEPNVTFDAVAVLESARVGADKRARVMKAQALLRSLPPDTPVEVGRQVVMASLRAFDVSLEEIVDAANAEISALVSFIQAGEDHTAARTARGEARIAELLAEIENVKANLAASAERQRTLTSAAREEMERVIPVLEFFEADASQEE